MVYIYFTWKLNVTIMVFVGRQEEYNNQIQFIQCLYEL